MASGMHQEVLQIPIDVIWNFMKDFDNWSPLVPGYVHHEKLNKRQSKWEFENDFGIFKKRVSFLVDIKEWRPPTKVGFDLKGDKYVGEGYFEAMAINRNKTRLIGFLDVNAIGAMEGMKNSILKNSVPKWVEEMALAIASNLEV